VPSLHTMDTDKDPARKKKSKAEIQAQLKRLFSEAQIKQKAYQERRADDAQLAKEARNVPEGVLPAEDDSDGSFNSKRNRNVTNRPRDQPSSSEEEHPMGFHYTSAGWAEEMDAAGGDVTMKEQASSSSSSTVALDKLKTKFKQDGPKDCRVVPAWDRQVRNENLANFGPEVTIEEARETTFNTKQEVDEFTLRPGAVAALLKAGRDVYALNKMRDGAEIGKGKPREVQGQIHAIQNKDKVMQDLFKKVKIELKEEEWVEPDAWKYWKAATPEDEVVTPEGSLPEEEEVVTPEDSDDDRWGSWEGKIFPQAEVIDSDDDQWGPCDERWNTHGKGSIGRARAEQYRERMVKQALELKQKLMTSGLKAARKKATDKARAMDEARSRAKALSLASSSSNKLVEVKQEPMAPVSKARPKAVAPVSKAKAKANHVPTPPDQPPTEEHIAAAAARARHREMKVKFWTDLKTAENNLRSATAKLYTGTPLEHLTETIRHQYIANIDYAKCRYAQIHTRCGQWSLVQQGANPTSELLMASLRVAAQARVNELEAIILVENHKRLKAIEEMVCENETWGKSWRGRFREENPQGQ
jgi:hypothetical protein